MWTREWMAFLLNCNQPEYIATHCPQSKPFQAESETPASPLHFNVALVGPSQHMLQHPISWNHQWLLHQTCISWDQLYQGHFSQAWAGAIHNLHPEMAMTGSQVMIKELQTIWQYVLDIWTLCNTYLHPYWMKTIFPYNTCIMVWLYTVDPISMKQDLH